MFTLLLVLYSVIATAYWLILIAVAVVEEAEPGHIPYERVGLPAKTYFIAGFNAILWPICLFRLFIHHRKGTSCQS